MARRNISLPDELDSLARQRELNVSALARGAIISELNRRDRMAHLDAWLDELDAAHGVPSAEVVAEADAWARSALPAPLREGADAPSVDSGPSNPDGARPPASRTTERGQKVARSDPLDTRHSRATDVRGPQR